MKKSGKIILTVLACIVAFYGIFVAADCIRLYNAEPGTKPIITISEDKENHRYNGLGYSVEYYINESETSYENSYGRECRLFGKILLWAYVSEKIQGADAPTEPEWRYPPMVMVNGELYIDTGNISDALRCGVMDGEIKSEVEGTEKPTQNDQSNFGKGYGYQYGQEGTIEVCIDGNWKVFATQVSG